MFTLNPQGEQELAEFWSTWTFVTERIDQLRFPRNTGAVPEGEN